MDFAKQPKVPAVAVTIVTTTSVHEDVQAPHVWCRPTRLLLLIAFDGF